MGVPTSNFSASPADADAIDRIEDRLRRIEKLMSAFQPATNSPLAMTSTDATGAFHKLSSPPKMVRQHRHSVQGISVAKEQAELRTAHALKKKRGMSPPPALFRETSTSAAARYATPPNSGGAKDYDFCTSSPSPPPPPLSPTAMMRQNSGQAQPLTSSMLNLSLSPSSSSTSSTSNSSMLQPLAPQSSLSTPPAGLVPSTTTPTGQQTSNGWPIKTELHNGQMVAQQPSPPSSSRSHHWSEEWKTTSMPSLMDQLSKRTFAASSAYNISTTNGGFPPYPLTPPHSYPRQQPSSPSPAPPPTDQVNSE
ncbi:hypothetical protein VTP01DRAFT_8815 [Rhizomucor pusillus]|uniref:uncharacterized protein n=1 Tax=Rhizomucor pusillus TaxID=4840 RepID=UPI0037445802